MMTLNLILAVALGPVGSVVFFAVIAIALFLLGRFLGNKGIPMISSLGKWACYIVGALIGLLAIYIAITELFTHFAETIFTIIFIAVIVFVIFTRTPIGFSTKKKKEEQHGWRSDGGVLYNSREAAEKASNDPKNVRMQ